MTELDLAADRLALWRRNPVAFVRDNFGVEPDLWQAEGLDYSVSCPGPKRISFQACGGVGKTAGLAWLGWHRLACFAEPGEHPKGAAVGNNKEQLSMNLWPELAKWRARSPFLSEAFQWTATRIYAKAHPETWFLAARAWNKDADAEEQGRVLSGLRTRFPFVLFDESATIPTQVGRAGEQAMSNCADGLLAQAGNPTGPEGMLYEAARQPEKWRVIPVTGDPDDPKRSQRVDIEWARAEIAEKGRDDPWVMALILGQFPPGGLRQLLSIEEVEAAMTRAVKATDYDWAAKILGVDIAREGLDSSVMFPRQGLVAFPPSSWHGGTGASGASLVARKWVEWKPDAVFIDDTGGFGAPVIEQLRSPLGFNPVGVHFAEKATDPRRYVNKRAEMWWRMAEWVKRGGSLPRCPELVGDLTTPLYDHRGDRLIIEDKAMVKKRLKRSPDHGDALALTFAHDVAPPAERMQEDTFLLTYTREPMAASRLDPYGEPEE